MPFWIEGWIEVARLPDTMAEHAWFGVVRLSTIVDVADADTERLFGLSRRCVTGNWDGDALAAARGMPPNPSGQVREAMQEIAAHEAKYGPGECGGYTHALWAELRDHELVEQCEDSELKLAFDLARVLEQRFGPERVRFVIWFNW
jgi:hypothetical protein